MDAAQHQFRQCFDSSRGNTENEDVLAASVLFVSFGVIRMQCAFTKGREKICPQRSGCGKNPTRFACQIFLKQLV